MIKNRILWILWLVCMAGAAVITGTWLFAAVLLLTVLILIFSAGSVVLSGKKAVIKLHLPKASERMECFHGKMYLENQSAWPVFGGAGVLRWENLFTGEKGVIPISFSLGGKEKQVIEFEAGSNWCGCIRFCFSDWKCQDFFRVFSLKRKADASAYTVVMPERQKGELSLFTREGFDMESFRYSGSRPGDDPGETYDIREYRSGDSIRQIHWKLSGKLDDIMIREKSFPVDDTVLILAEAFQAERDPQRWQKSFQQSFRALWKRRSPARPESMTTALGSSGWRRSVQKRTAKTSCTASCVMEVMQKHRSQYGNI